MLDVVKIVGLTFLAELGDKTMLSTAAIALRSRSVAKVLTYSALAFIIANSLSVALAACLRIVLDPRILQFVSAVLFVVLGVWIAMSRSEEVKGCEMATYLASLVLAEMGDKTQFTVFSLATTASNPFLVLPIALIGYVVANALMVFLVTRIRRAVSMKIVKIVASVVMVGVGIAMLLQIPFS